MKEIMRRHSVLFAFALAFAPVYAQQPLTPPLKNWAAPLYWQPTPAEAQRLSIEQRIAHPEASSLAQAASIFTAPGPMTFIAITPCRVMDTRGAPYTPAGAFGPPSYPSLSSGVGLSVPMPSSSDCSIPSNAGAYSLNITAISDGGGVLSSLSVWPVGQPYPGVSTLNDSVPGGIIANAAIVVAGTAGAIQMVAFSSAGTTTDVIIDINGYYADPTDGSFNTGIGTGALQSNTTGAGNTADGADALLRNTIGSQNTASGAAALENNTSGIGNTASGNLALQLNTSGSSNTANGTNALQNNTSGSQNTASGGSALFSNTTGSQNTAMGYLALSSNTADGNTALGYEALQANGQGDVNIAVGFQALQLNTIGSDNAALGTFALRNNTTGTDNTATGAEAMAGNTTGNYNTATGTGALDSNSTGSYNTSIGATALQANTTGSNNTALGYLALSGNDVGSGNTAIGFRALNSQSGNMATQNTALGYEAGFDNITGEANTALGYGALGNNIAGSVNVAVGFLAGTNITGDNNVDIASGGASADNGVIRIGTATLQTSAFMAGVFGVLPPGSATDVFVNTNGQLGTLVSSRRFKEQITDMGDTSNKLFQLRPVNFFYKPEYDDGSHLQQYGLIAEEVEKVYPEMVVYDKDGQILSVKYQMLAPMLLNEVQKQNAQIQNQAQALQLQQESNRKLEDRLAALEALLSSQAAEAAKRGAANK